MSALTEDDDLAELLAAVDDGDPAALAWRDSEPDAPVAPGDDSPASCVACRRLDALLPVHEHLEPELQPIDPASDPVIAASTLEIGFGGPATGL